MTIDTLSDLKLKIRLTEDEIQTLFGGFERINYSSSRTKLALNMILREAAPKSAFPLDCDRLLIEVKPEEGGCVIIFTKLYGGESQDTIRKMPSQRIYTLDFSDSESMIRGLCELYCDRELPSVKSDLYRYQSGYRLIITSDKSLVRQLFHMKEYCTEVSRSCAVAASAAEYGDLVSAGTAIQKIGAAFGIKRPEPEEREGERLEG